MRGKLKILALFLLAFVCCCCSNEYDPYYLNDDIVGIVVDSKTIFKYEDLTCQLSYDRSECKFAAFKDDMSSFFILTLGSVPDGEKQSIGHCSLKYTTSNNVVSLDDLTFSVEKRDALEGLLWLWCSEKNIFIITRML